jgi:hypothetical protein
MLRIAFFEDPRFTAASTAITLVFFALFGSVFLLTQYLQFVLNYTPLEAGFRITPIATLVIAAPIAARLVEKVGTKIVVTVGLLVVATALGILAQVDAGSGYGLVATVLPIMGFGMGMTMAPATESIMGSLPLGKAGVGSAMNDTTRMVGGALGVAVVGSALSSSYQVNMESVVAQLPGRAAAIAGDSIGGAHALVERLGPQAAGILRGAEAAFVDAFGNAVLISAAAAVLGALVTLFFLPARGREDLSTARDAASAPVPARSEA